MSTLAEFLIVAGADNHPLMLDKPNYESWKSHMELYIQRKEHGRIILNSVENGPLVWPTVEQEDGTVRLKTYEELSDKEKLQANCDLKATNIVLQGTSLSRQERECKLYDEFDKFPHVKGETLHQYYFLPSEWGKFVTDVKLARDLYTSNYDQLYAYLEQHEAHANESHLMRLAVPTFLPGDDPIACMNKAMAFMSAVFSLRYPSTNNQIRSSSNSRNQANVQDGEGHIARQCTQPKMLGIQCSKEIRLGLILYRAPCAIKGVLSLDLSKVTITLQAKALDLSFGTQQVFKIHQYLQHKHYALWEVIEFGDSYKVPPEETAKDKSLTGEGSGSTKKKGRTVAITMEVMQKRRNDVKARTTLLLALPNEH
ncbi:hypothetical protein Tco_0270785 [Tanacetum coccineum]